MAAFALAAQPLPITRISVDAAGVEAKGLSAAAGSPSLSADGRWVVFVSGAANLVPLDTNLSDDVFLKNTATGSIERMNLDAAGNEAPVGSFSDTPSSAATDQSLRSVVLRLWILLT